MPDPSSTDDDLLARLNALKKSSVNLNPSYSSPVATRADDLAARFSRLASPSPSSSSHPPQTTSVNHEASVVAPGASTSLEGLAQGVGGSSIEFNEEDKKTLEELLGDLNGTVGDRKEWDMSAKEQADIGELLKDMKTILPQVINSQSKDPQRAKVSPYQVAQPERTDWESIQVNVAGGAVHARPEDPGEGDEQDSNEEREKRTEEEEADDVIAMIMAELEISRKHDPPSPPTERDDTASRDQEDSPKDDVSATSINLPSAPTSLPEDEDDFERTQAIEEAFTARLAALSAPSASQSHSLSLPSAPSFSPHDHPLVASTLQDRLDEEIETWCIICQDDATLRCTGCDDDLYCQNCWMEGHKGESAGFEEQRHKAVLFVKKKKKPQMVT